MYKHQFFSRVCVAVACIFGLAHAPNASALSTPCNDIEFIFARGSGEALDDVSYTAWRHALEPRLLGLSGLTYHFYELGAYAQDGAKYPAVTINPSEKGGLENVTGAVLSLGQAYTYGESVREGREELMTYTHHLSRACPGTKYVLGGYSQGAQVMSSALPLFDAKKVLYVATFADPRSYFPEGYPLTASGTPKVPDACYGRNLSSYREYVPNCFAYAGALGATIPYEPTGYSGKLGTWCYGNDLICSSGYSLDDHTKYVSSNLYADAADKILAQLSRAFPSETVSSPLQKALHEVLFLFDTTGSMYSAISEYRSEAKALAAKVLQSGGRIALFGYGDLVDRTEPATKYCDFSCSLEDFSSAIDSIVPDAGGDEPESVLSASVAAMDAVDWTYGATKSLIVLTDASYHSPDLDGTTEADALAKSLSIDPVNFYVLTPTSGLASRYSNLATSTGGKTFSLGSDIELSTDTIYNRPIAVLNQENFYGLVGEPFTFDASASSSPTGDTLTYSWDLDADGIFELTNSSAQLAHTYSSPLSGYIQVKVIDGAGRSSTMSANLTVIDPSDLETPTTITDLRIDLSENAAPARTSQPSYTATISFSTDAAQVLLGLDDAIAGAIRPTSGQGTITLTDLTQSTDVTLAPYSASGHRGDAVVAHIILENGSYRIDFSHELGITKNTLPVTGLGFVEPAEVVLELPKDVIIPAAPNTGVAPAF